MEKTAPRRAIRVGQSGLPFPVQLPVTPESRVAPEVLDGDMDQAMPSPYGVPPLVAINAEEEFRLRAILKERKIDALIHFTRLENLASILNYGLMARKMIETDARIGRVQTNQPELPSEWQSMIALNISFPDYRLFYRMQEQRGYEWVVLVYDAALLTQQSFFSFIFPAANLIRTPIFAKEIAPWLQSVSTFEDLFKDTDTVRRRLLQIPDAYPTHPYSELLVPGTIANQYLKEVHFYNEYKFDQWCFQNQGLAGIIDKNLWQVGLTYFSPRMDYANWRTALR